MLAQVRVSRCATLAYHLQRILRNAYYRCSHLRINSCYQLFNRLYQYNPAPWPWIHRVDGHSYLTAQFLHPDLAVYQGYEVVQFNAKSLACYWLPGARSGAHGSVPPGEYLLKINSLLSSKIIYFKVEKFPTQIRCEINQTAAENEVSAYHLLFMNRLKYAIIVPELFALINHWVLQHDSNPTMLQAVQVELNKLEDYHHD